jgi:hypothetical protein
MFDPPCNMSRLDVWAGKWIARRNTRCKTMIADMQSSGGVFAPPVSVARPAGHARAACNAVRTLSAEFDRKVGTYLPLLGNVRCPAGSVPFRRESSALAALAALSFLYFWIQAEPRLRIHLRVRVLWRTLTEAPTTGDTIRGFLGHRVHPTEHADMVAANPPLGEQAQTPQRQIAKGGAIDSRTSERRIRVKASWKQHPDYPQ